MLRIDPTSFLRSVVLAFCAAPAIFATATFAAEVARLQPLPPALASLASRANAAAPGVTSKDPAIVKKAQAQLATVNAELRNYANKNGLKVTSVTRRPTPGSQPARQQVCAGSTMNTAGQVFTLRQARLGADGVLQCEYDSITIPAATVPPKKAVWTPQGPRQTGSHMR